MSGGAEGVPSIVRGGGEVLGGLCGAGAVVGADGDLWIGQAGLRGGDARLIGLSWSIGSGGHIVESLEGAEAHTDFEIHPAADIEAEFTAAADVDFIDAEANAAFG